MNHSAITRRRTLIFGFAAICSFTLPSYAQLATPTAIVLPEIARIIVGFPPGGAPDVIARRMAEQLTGKLAKAVIVDNRPGAGGRIALDVARQSPADGLTLLLNPAGVLTINPHSYKKLNYEPFKDLSPISLAANIDFGFAVGSGVPPEIKTIAEFTQWAKANPGKVSYGSPAAGSPPHFIGDALSRQQGIDITHIPYRGGVSMINDLIGGQLASGILTLGDLIPHEKSGKLRILAVSGTSRSRFLPQVPTFLEQKVTGLDLRDWMAFYIAGKPNPAVMARVATLVSAAAASPAFAQSLAVSGLEAAASTPEDLDKLGRKDLDRWGPVVKASGFVAD